MRSLKYIFLLALGISVYAYFSDYFTTKVEEEKLKTAFTDKLKDCNYAPFEKLNPPYFEGAIGYLIPNNLDNEKDFNIPWKIKTYTQTGPEHYTELKLRIPERTRVKVVKEHILKNSSFESYLTIQCLDILHNELFIVRGDSFSEIPYWNCSLEQAIKQAPILAKLKPDAEPPTFEGQWLKLSEKAIIICTNVTGFQNEFIEAYVYDPSSKKYYYSSVTFKKETLFLAQ